MRVTETPEVVGQGGQLNIRILANIEAKLLQSYELLLLLALPDFQTFRRLWLTTAANTSEIRQSISAALFVIHRESKDAVNGFLILSSLHFLLPT